MAVVGGLLIFIGLAGMGVAIWALVKGGLGWANIANRKVAGGVLAGGLVVAMIGGGISPQDDEDQVAVQAGQESTTTTTEAPTTSTIEASTTSTTAAASTTRSIPETTTTTARATTTTTKPPTTTTAKPTTTSTSRPTTTTTTPPVTQPPTAQLAFGTMQCDAPGSPDNSSNTNDEWVELVNSGGAAVGLTGWALHDEGPNYTFTFPAFTLAPGAAVKIHTGSGANTATDLYWGQNQHVWNNTGVEIAYLKNSTGALVTSKACR